MQVWPMPINPANWPPGVIALTDTAVRLWGEVESQWERASAREDFKGNLPLILLWSVIGIAMVWRGRWLMERVAAALRGHATAALAPAVGAGRLAGAGRAAHRRVHTDRAGDPC